MNCLPRRFLASLATLLIAAHAHAFEAGWMQIQTAGATPDAPMTTVALYYPTLAAPRVVAMGPFSVDAAIGGKPVDKVKALILLSHGISGTELGHSTLAQALARNGYLVAALRHPGDNYQDRSLWRRAPSATSTSGRAKPPVSSTQSWPTRLGRAALRPTTRGLWWVRWGTRQAATRCWRWQGPSQTCPG